MMAGETVNELDISGTGGRLQAWLAKTVWISVHAGEARPLLTADGELAYERGYLDIEQQAAREFGGKLEGVFAFHVGSMRRTSPPRISVARADVSTRSVSAWTGRRFGYATSSGARSTGKGRTDGAYVDPR
jgi:hypothetical protein